MDEIQSISVQTIEPLQNVEVYIYQNKVQLVRLKLNGLSGGDLL